MTIHLTDLCNFIIEYYSLNELHTLCFEIGIEFENLGGRTRKAKARELVLYMGREGRLDDLLEALQVTRPHIFSQSEIDSKLELERLYAELKAFEVATRPLTEKILSRVGLEQRVGFVILALFVIGGGILLYFGLRVPGLDRMTGDFNVAVAPFQVIGEVELARGEDVANSIYNRLNAVVEELDEPVIHVWGPVEPRLNPVPIIEGQTATERAQAAAELAGEINADVIVYGIVDVVNGNWQITPEFFISSQNFQEASEILGQYRLGEPLLILGDDPSTLRITSGDKLRPRSEMIAQIAVGLTYYSITAYDRALTEFKQLEERGDLKNDSGAEVLYLLIGNTLGKQAAALRQNANDIDQENVDTEATELLIEAIAYYEKALAIDPEYARGYSGIGSAAYLLALGDGSEVNKNQLLTSITSLNAGLAAQNKPPNSFVETKLHMNLGQSYLLLSFIDETVGFEPAIQEFDRVVADHEGLAEPNGIVRELAGEAHARLGLIAFESGNIDQAITAYETAIDLLFDRPERQALYQQRLNELTRDSS
ncbi:MAG: hypothetical protein DWQ04_33950 [Chloroflexi bacterium]|nr:MAG: hypothetical protein DWQ04_33950 [Chloroflexota bacterium]